MTKGGGFAIPGETYSQFTNDYLLLLFLEVLLWQ
jgi:hypothetical protein